MDAVKVRYRVVVSGRVQGVCYRASCAAEARALSLEGWVRNRRDGTVELEVQGAEPEVQALIEWCQSGPPAARVASVDPSPMDPREGEPPGFRVVR